MKRDSAKLDGVIDDAVQAIKYVLKPGEKTDNQVATARIASSVLATWAKLKQSERAQEGIYFMMARELAENKEQLEQYIKMTMPDVPLVTVLDAKQLPSPKKK